MRTLTYILLAGLVTGTLDLLNAFASLSTHGQTMEEILKYIAAGMVGPAALRGGMEMAWLGLFCHFALTIAMAAVFLFAALRFSALAAQPWLWGAVYGASIDRRRQLQQAHCPPPESCRRHGEDARQEYSFQDGRERPDACGDSGSRSRHHRLLSSSSRICLARAANAASPPAANQPIRSSSMYQATPAAMYQRWSACIAIGRMGVIGNGKSVAPVMRRATCSPIAVAAAMPRPL